MVSEPSRVKLICGVICAGNLFQKVEEALICHFGEIDGRSAPFAFDFTDYYEKEMGKHLWRRWVGFEKLISQQELGKMKLLAIELEKRLAREDGSRRANLDPGYIAASKLVLATTKDYSHRVYLGDGIFAEVALIYEKGTFHPLGWTYADYKRDDALEFFAKMREGLKQVLSE